MKVALDQNDRQFLDQMHRIGPGTIQVICEAMGVTATAVRQRLTRLQALDLVSRQLVRSGRGRPHYVYRVTDAGANQLGENYGELALILWQEVQRIEEAEVRQRVIARIRDAFIRRYGAVVQAETLPGRVRQLQAALVERGFDVETDEVDGLPILRENNCPYQELASADSSICEMEQEVFERVLGAEVTLTQCCLEGHHCCEFQATETGKFGEQVVAGSR